MQICFPVLLEVIAYLCFPILLILNIQTYLNRGLYLLLLIAKFYQLRISIRVTYRITVVLIVFMNSRTNISIIASKLNRMKDKQANLGQFKRWKSDYRKASSKIQFVSVMKIKLSKLELLQFFNLANFYGYYA